MSLSLLLPPTPSPSPSPSPPTRSPHQTRSEITADLEAHTRALIAAFNSRDCLRFKTLAAHLFSPSFRSGPCATQREHNCADLLVCSASMLARSPRHHLRIVGVEVQVEGKGEEGREGAGERGPWDVAEVYMFSETTGTHRGVRGRNVSLLRWKRMRGRWRCVRWDIIRGIGGPWVGEAGAN